MTARLFQNPDGASASARAVLAYLSGYERIEKSWCRDVNMSLAEPSVARWENCREQGYVVYMRDYTYTKQINIAFFGHRNSTNLCCVVFEGNTINSPTINDVHVTHPYWIKGEADYTVEYEGAEEMASFIFQKLKKFWVENNTGEMK